MPMSPRLLRPIASGVHPEAAAWRTAVVANGGSVSASTMRAVSRFCSDIDKAVIRDRFFRLNLFCGNSDSSLVAVRTPLYRGPSPAGTQYGATIDTNGGNTFAQGDYAETGASGGLKGNTTTKYLDTELTQATVAADGFMHLSVFARHGTYSANVTFRMIGLISTSPSNQFYFVDTRRSFGVTEFVSVCGGGTNLSQAPSTLSGGQLMLVTRSTASDARSYLNATEAQSDTVSRSVASVASNMFVFAENRVGTGAQTFAAMTLGAYSMGLPMTAAQVSSFNNAMSTFQSALSRNSGV